MNPIFQFYPHDVYESLVWMQDVCEPLAGMQLEVSITYCCIKYKAFKKYGDICLIAFKIMMSLWYLTGHPRNGQCSSCQFDFEALVSKWSCISDFFAIATANKIYHYHFILQEGLQFFIFFCNKQ